MAKMATWVRFLLACAWALCALFASGCDSPFGGASAPTPPIPTSIPTQIAAPIGTPTVDLAHARQAVDAGGELTYEEVIALRLAIVGDPAEIDKLISGDFDKYYKAQDDFLAREKDFAAKLEKCKLKETYGWIAWSRQEHDKDYKDIPDKNQLAVYVYNPFYGFGKELRGGPEMFLVYFTDNDVATLKAGQRLKFSGDLLLVDGQESVKNPAYAFLDDEPLVPTPTSDEMKDLHITLCRTMCFGTCPDYTLTVEPDGKVTFEGRHYTTVGVGTVTSTIGQDKLIELATEIHKADFFSLDDNYYVDVTDNPTYTLTIQMGGNHKQVVSYATSPRRLRILMNRIDQIVNSYQWIDKGK
jgi:hypothetical protein